MWYCQHDEEDVADIVSVYINITERKAYLSFIRSKDVVDFVICGFVQFTLSSWEQRTNQHDDKG